MRPEPLTNVEANQLVSPTTIAPSVAAPRPATANPCTSHPTMSNEMPFNGMIHGAASMGLADGPTEVHKVTVARQLLREYKATGPAYREHVRTRDRQGARYVPARAQCPAG